LHVSDANGCLADDSTYIYDDGSPHSILLSYTAPLCFGDQNGSVTLGGLGGAAPYKYSFDGFNFYTTAQINNISAGEYTLFVRDANSCLRDTVIYLSQPTVLQINHILSDTVSCFHDALSGFTIFASGATPPYQYRIDGGTWQSAPYFSSLAAGTYFVEVSDSNNCILSTYFAHQIHRPDAELHITLKKIDVECYKTNTGSIEAGVSGGWPPYLIDWSHSNTSSLHLNELYVGNYILTVSDQRACVTTSSIELYQEDCCHLTIPNAFSPNHDLVNDIFRPVSPTMINTIRLQIFNRTINGKEASVDTYFYLLEYECNLTSKIISLKGDVSLIR
jgi:hypothetical protein